MIDPIENNMVNEALWGWQDPDPDELDCGCYGTCECDEEDDD